MHFLLLHYYYMHAHTKAHTNTQESVVFLLSEHFFEQFDNCQILNEQNILVE